MPVYTVNEDAVRDATLLIDARQYVLRSRWQSVQPHAIWITGALDDAPDAVSRMGGAWIRLSGGGSGLSR